VLPIVPTMNAPDARNGYGAPQSSSDLPPEILQIVPATGWWIDVPSIDEQTGAIMTNRMRAIAFALCRFPSGIEVRPINNLGQIADCANLSHEADAGLISKYKKRARATTDPASGNPIPEDDEPIVDPASSAKPDDRQLKHLKTSLFEGLQWVSAILDKDPGDELLRSARQQLRWMQSAVDNGRRPTIAELGQVDISKRIVPELKADDPYLAGMLSEIESLYREL
jgi:hypothetical protein